MVAGIIGYIILLKVNFVNALYMTVITISTVGFGEVAAMNSQAEIFLVILIFWGVGIVGYTFTTLVIFFVEGKMTEIWKGRNMEGEKNGQENICTT